MPSYSYRLWRTKRTRSLDAIAQAHAVIGGPARGRRFATQQINHAYAVLLASQFQGFCRDLHSECVDHVLSVVASRDAVKALIRDELMRGRQLDRGNAHPSSLGADYRRLGVELWDQLRIHNANADQWKDQLTRLNEWRNAIVHEDFTSPKLGEIIFLRLEVVRRWRKNCSHLVRAMDEVTRAHLAQLTGISPW